MKLSKCLLAIAALTVAFTLSAKADLQFLGAVNFGNGPNDPGTNHDVLEAFLGFDPGALNSNFESGLSGAVDVDRGRTALAQAPAPAFGGVLGQPEALVFDCDREHPLQEVDRPVDRPRRERSGSTAEPAEPRQW